jgi:hypothetical protein
MNKESSAERLPAKTNVFYDQRVNYALQQNDVPVVKLLQVENTGEEDLRDLTLEVWIEGGLSERGRCRIDRVPAGGVFNVEEFDLALDPGRLARQVEREATRLHVRLQSNDGRAREDRLPIEVLAANE